MYSYQHVNMQIGGVLLCSCVHVCSVCKSEHLCACSVCNTPVINSLCPTLWFGTFSIWKPNAKSGHPLAYFSISDSDQAFPQDLSKSDEGKT